jgi:hypothetical protein
VPEFGASALPSCRVPRNRSTNVSITRNITTFGLLRRELRPSSLPMTWWPILTDKNKLLNKGRTFSLTAAGEKPLSSATQLCGLLLLAGPPSRIKANASFAPRAKRGNQTSLAASSPALARGTQSSVLCLCRPPLRSAPPLCYRFAPRVRNASPCTCLPCWHGPGPRRVCEPTKQCHSKTDEQSR